MFYDRKCIAVDSRFKLLHDGMGSWSEMFAVQDLMRQGYTVYKTMTDPAPYPLLVMKDGQIHRVEIVLSRRTEIGKFYIPRRVLTAEYEILALVLPEDLSIHYHTTVDLELEPVLSSDD